MPNPFAWEFMDEPLWRWFIFLVAISAMLTAWRGVVEYIK